MMRMVNQRIVTATVPGELLKRAHERAELEDRSIASIVRIALANYLRSPKRDAVPTETRAKG